MSKAKIAFFCRFRIVFYLCLLHSFEAIETETFLPEDAAAWDEAYAKVKHLLIQ